MKSLLIPGPVSLLSYSNLGNSWKFSIKDLANIDFDGENGNADKYRCGVLLSMIPAKFCTNLIPSLMNIKGSSYSILPC